MNTSNTEEEILVQIQEIFKRAMGNEVVVNAATTRNEVPEWDSINHLNLIVELESAYDLGLSMENIEHIQSVKEILQLVKSRLGNS